MIHPAEIEYIGFSALFHLCRANIRKSEAEINCFVLIFLWDNREIQVNLRLTRFWVVAGGGSVLSQLVFMLPPLLGIFTGE
jgi:hypothetical protein